MMDLGESQAAALQHTVCNDWENGAKKCINDTLSTGICCSVLRLNRGKIKMELHTFHAMPEHEPALSLCSALCVIVFLMLKWLFDLNMSSLVPGCITLLLKLECTFTALRLELPPGQFFSGTPSFSLIMPAASSTLTLLSLKARGSNPSSHNLMGVKWKKTLVYHAFGAH